MAPVPSKITRVQMHEETSWPSGFKYEDFLNKPCQALSDYNGSLPNTIPVKKGARGYVSLLNNSERSLVRFRVIPCDAIDGNEEGWVPSRVVELGVERQYKDTVLSQIEQRIEDVTPHVSLSDLNLTNDSSPFLKNSAAFLQAIVDESDHLRFIPDTALNYIRRITPNKLAMVARETAPKVMQLLESGKKFNVEDLRQAAPLLRSTDNVGGIYMRYYADYSGNPSKRKAIYIGQSIHMVDRQEEHRKAMKSLAFDQYHYRVTRDAKTVEARLICKTKDGILLDIVEQLMISILDCYCPPVKDGKLEDATYSMPVDVLATDPSKKPFQVMEEAPFVEKDCTIVGRVVRQVFARVKARTAWPGCCDENHFGAKGLNHASPLSSFARTEQNIWTRMVIPDKGVTQYRRAGATVTFHKNEAGAAQHDVNIVETVQRVSVPGLDEADLKCKTSSFSFQWSPKDVGPPLGANVTVCIEILDGDRIHPKRWAGLPTVGPWKNWKRANQLAIRLEWIENGKHLHCYFTSFLQLDIMQDEDKDNAVGALRGYAIVEGLRRFLEQETVTDPPFWYIHYGRSRVKDVRFDWLRQAWVFTDLSPPPPTTRESLKMAEEIFKELRQAGFPADDIGSEFGKLPFRADAPLRSRKSRSTCDRCYVASCDPSLVLTIPPGTAKRMQKASRVTDHCRQEPEDDPTSLVCQHCWDFGMLCTWTPSHDLYKAANIAKLDAISFQPRTNTSRELAHTPDQRIVHQVQQKPLLPS